MTLILAFAGWCVLSPSPASAGGSWLDPVLDRYEPGETATLVGYIGPGQLGWVEDGPFYAYLDGGFMATTGLPIGPFLIEETERWNLRVSITFEIPSDLEPGRHGVGYCNDPCDEGLGDLIGAHLYVGADPSSPISRWWPLDDPEIANLADETVISGPASEGFFDVIAADIRADRLPAQIRNNPSNYAFGSLPSVAASTEPESIIASVATVAPAVAIASEPAAPLSGGAGASRWRMPAVLGSGIIGLLAVLAISRRRTRFPTATRDTAVSLDVGRGCVDPTASRHDTTVGGGASR